MENYLLGLDNGGTMVKAVIFDGNGKEVAGAATKLRMITPEASMTERDMEELWEANCQVIREALAKAGGGAAEKIRGCPAAALYGAQTRAAALFMQTAGNH